MKRIFLFIAIAICAFGLSSCLNSDDHSTPLIQFSRYVYRSTLEGVQDSVKLTDTVNVGDTLRLPILLYGGFNNLTEFKVTYESSECDFKLLIDSAYTQHLTDASDPENGYLKFIEDIYVYPTAMWFVPQKTGDLKISMTLSSTAGEKYSPLNAWFIFPVKEN